MIHPQFPEQVLTGLSSSFREVKELFASMDSAYEEQAGCAGFTCTGCRENCCEERFYHYTLIEALYLREGIISLAPDIRKPVIARAEEIVALCNEDDISGIDRRIMCPLNHEGLCILYAYRPMICRLHGIPHILTKSGQKQRGSGCGPYEQNFGSGNHPDRALDRTPFYRRLAEIEIDVRRSLNFRDRIRKTVAEIVSEASVPHP